MKWAISLALVALVAVGLWKFFLINERGENPYLNKLIFVEVQSEKETILSVTPEKDNFIILTENGEYSTRFLPSSDDIDVTIFPDGSRELSGFAMGNGKSWTRRKMYSDIFLNYPDETPKMYDFTYVIKTGEDYTRFVNWYAISNNLIFDRGYVGFVGKSIGVLFVIMSFFLYLYLIPYSRKADRESTMAND